VTDVDAGDVERRPAGAERLPPRPSRARSGADLDELARLEEERRFLLRSLTDLAREHEAGDLDDLDYETLRDDYTARAATVLRAIEAGRAALPPRPGGRRRRRRTIAVVLVTAAVAVGGGIAVAASSGTRLPGGGITGAMDQSTTTLLSQARLVGNRASNEQDAGGLLDAAKLYDQVLATEPGNVEALTYRGWVLWQLGRGTDKDAFVTTGEQSIDQAIALKADYPDAHAFKGVILQVQHDDAAGAMDQFQQFLADDPPPELRAEVETLIEQASKDSGVPVPTTAAPTLTPVTPVTPVTTAAPPATGG
jgi:hypothetical protein